MHNVKYSFIKLYKKPLGMSIEVVQAANSLIITLAFL